MTTALLTDHYELTMVDAALRDGTAHRTCVFETFARRLPPGRRFGVVAGLGRLVDAITDFRFDDRQLGYLDDHSLVSPQTLEFLAGYRFTGELHAFREGEVYFPGTPVLTVCAPFAEAVVLETLVLSVLNYDSAVASAAARMTIAAQGRPLLEFGSRRAHEWAAVAAARATYVAGFAATSNLQAGLQYGIPTRGTSAHAFTLLHDDELSAFRSQIEAQGYDTTLLVDTFDIEEGLLRAFDAETGEILWQSPPLGATVQTSTITYAVDGKQYIAVINGEGLTGARGLAACMVALFHLHYLGVHGNLYEVPLLQNSWQSVDFFFVLSGFVIAANYQQRLLDGFGAGRFLLLRLGRIYPLHFVMLAVGVTLKLLLLLAPAFSSITETASPPFTSREEAPHTILANLLLIRAATRRHEIAVRLALGAGRGRIARQLLTESVLIGLLGGATGVLVAFVGVRALLALAPAGRIPRIDEVHMNGWALGFTLAISLVTGILFGVVPALGGARRQPSEALGQGTRVVGGPQQRLRAAFVIAEIALALVLLTGAGLMIKSFILMRSLDTGYDARRVVTMAVDLPSIAYPDATRIQAFHTALLEGLARIPEVEAVGAVSYRPMGDMGIMGDFQVEGPSPLPHGYSVGKPTVSPGYFRALGIRLLAGRDFTAADRTGAPGVVVASESVARRVWPGQEAVGKRISMSDRPGPNDWLTVIGVVADVVQDAQLSRHSTLYLPYLQTTSPFFISHMTFVVRQRPASAPVAPAMRAALRDVDPAVPAQALQTMDESMLDTIAEPVFQMRLLATFALFALLLAALGTYGVLTYDVTERTREIGLRLALGASPGNVLRMVLRRSAAMALGGAAIGVAGALALTRVLSTSLFEVKPTDPATLAAVTGVLVLAALLAGYLPAQRAAGIRAVRAMLHG